MCLIFIAFNNHPQYKLIVAANRDEFYNRKTAPADHWQDHPEIIGGRDLQASGTWLAMNKGGKISMVTNYRDLKNLKPDAPSRGELVTNFLLTPQDSRQYLQSIEPNAKAYNGFNLICGSANELGYLSNYKEGIQQLSPGIYGLSNHLLDTPWPKVRIGKKNFAQTINKAFVPDDLFTLLYNHDIADDSELPETGVGLERERALSAMFIKSPGYGTRSSTVVLVDNSDNVFFAERVFDLETFTHTENTFTFKT